MKTNITSGQMLKLLNLLEQKGVTPDRFQDILSSGILSDLFDSRAYLENRSAVREAVRVGSNKVAVSAVVKVGICKEMNELRNLFVSITGQPYPFDNYNDISFSETVMEVGVVAVSPVSLGLSNATIYDGDGKSSITNFDMSEFHKKVDDLGLKPCSNEVAMMVFLQHIYGHDYFARHIFSRALVATDNPFVEKKGYKDTLTFSHEKDWRMSTFEDWKPSKSIENMDPRKYWVYTLPWKDKESTDVPKDLPTPEESMDDIIRVRDTLLGC